MTKLRFGTQEDVVCIMDVSIRVKGEGDMCLAYKSSTHFFLGGVYVTDDGYVLKSKQGGFYPLDANAIRAHQGVGELPSPLPAYSLPWTTYVIGYSLWIAIAITILAGVLKSVRAKRRKGQLEQLRATRPVRSGPPDVRTNADRYIAANITPHLRPGEQVQHQAYGIDRDISEGGLDSMAAMGLFGVLTTQRLFFIKTRIGAFGVLLENHGIEAFERSAISNVAERGDMLTFQLVDGQARKILVKRSARGLSNQLEFLRDVPRLLAPGPSMPPPYAPSFARRAP